MSLSERRTFIPTNSILNPEQQRVIDSIEDSLSETIPPEIFNQAGEIISRHTESRQFDILNFSQRKLNDHEGEEVGRLYKEEWLTERELGIKFNVSHVTIDNTLRVLGIKRRSVGPNPPEIIHLPSDETIAALYNQGLTLEEIGKSLGVDDSTIRKRLQRADIKIRPASRRPLELPIEEIAKKYNAGKSSNELGTEYSVDGVTILRRLRSAGVEIKPDGRYPKKK